MSNVTAPQPKTQKSAAALFKSKEQESHQFEVMGIRPTRTGDNRLLFRVPQKDAERFAKHHHVKTGRIVKV